MSSTLLRTCLFLALLLPLARARPQDQERTSGGFSLGMVNDWVPSGNYLIYSCGSKAADVKNILDMTYLALQTAILSTDSAAYGAFFRTADPASVTAVLSNITAGAKIKTLRHGLRAPVLVCVNALDAGIRTFWNMCQESERTAVIQPPETSLVFLCPVFFDQKPLPLSTDCATVNHAGTAFLAHHYIAGAQYGFLVHALADMYIRQRVPGRALGGDVGGENACLALPPDQALMNPSSYAYYVSCK
ncbi:MAG: hypothetical protein ALECFALPRED_004169 [Alectoria fallacina]|uniref:Uncharacterized protein n=1 Tax=Alectoria fallacina TaxID=1903189 RepID=A0A8H3FQH1_9LECA|nr:MAG: hypothetical protein ALECFALPRED_004169 [Alectoria fallacina]